MEHQEVILKEYKTEYSALTDQINQLIAKRSAVDRKMAKLKLEIFEKDFHQIFDHFF